MGYKNDKIKDFYANEGILVLWDDYTVLGIHPNNVENNLKLLKNEDMKIDWKAVKKNMKGKHPNSSLKIFYKGNLVVGMSGFDPVEILDAFINEDIRIDWTTVERSARIMKARKVEDD